jgi:hypothetical protein
LVDTHTKLLLLVTHLYHLNVSLCQLCWSDRDATQAQAIRHALACYFPRVIIINGIEQKLCVSLVDISSIFTGAGLLFRSRAP